MTYCYDGNVAASGGGSCTSAQPAIPYPVGRLTQVYSSTSSTSYLAFDELGRVLASSQKTPGATGATYSFGTSASDPGYAYNRAGARTWMKYPSGRQVSYDYDAAGRISRVRNGPPASSVLYADASVFDAQAHQYSYASNGALQYLVLGNGLAEWTTWDPLRQQPTQIQVGSLLTLHYYYCPGGGSSCATNNGNLLRQTIATPAMTWTQDYGYTDGVNRLTSVSETNNVPQATWSQTYLYDAYGNRAVTAGYIPYAGLTPTSLSQFTGNRVTGAGLGTSYDNAGNLLSMSGSRGYSYDAENRLTSTTQPLGWTAQYSYDGDGRRVQKTVSGAVTTYVYDAGGNLAADYGPTTDAGTSYLSGDHLGSTRLMTDAGGAVKRRYDYLPFGEDVPQNQFGRDGTYAAGSYPGAADIEAVKFTGKERDAETGLDFFGARYFSGAQGRFTSPDPIFFQTEMLTDPQRFNLYSYVRNSPLRYVDPKGEAVELTGNAQQRKEEMEALCSAVGAQACGYLGVTSQTKDGKTTYTVTINGDASAFAEINEAAAGFADIIQNPEVAKFARVPSGEELEVQDAAGHSRTLGGKPAVGLTQRDPSGQLWVYVVQKTECCSSESGSDFGRIGGRLGSFLDWLGITSVSADAGTVAGHEFGHARAMMFVGPVQNPQERSNKSALDLENAVRKARDPNAPVRTGHQ